MKFADEISREKVDILRFKITGGDEAWERLQGRVFSLIDTIVDRIEKSNPGGVEALETTRDVVKDMSSLVGGWVRAKVEKPSLENQKLHAEIINKFAEPRSILRKHEKLKRRQELLKWRLNRRT